MKRFVFFLFSAVLFSLFAREYQKLPEQWRFSGLVYSKTDFPVSKLPANAEKVNFDDGKWALRNVPKNWLEDIPAARKEFYMSGMYRVRTMIPAKWNKGRILLHFQGSSYETSVFVNGKKAGFHRGAYADFFIDITKELSAGKENLIAVRVDFTNDRSRRAVLTDYPFPGERGGIYGPVALEYVPDVFIERAFIDASPADGKVAVRLRVNNTLGKTIKESLTVRIGKQTFSLGKLELKAGVQEVRSAFQMKSHKNWNIGKPQLYRTEILLGKDIYRTSFGFARFEVRSDRLYFNGIPITLFARHFGGFFLPNGAPRRVGGVSIPWNVQKKSILKLFRDQLKDNCNMLRFLGAQGCPEFTYEATDEAGILVYQEWSNYGIGKNLSAKYLDDAIEEIGEFLEMVYNNPSVVMFSFANESSGTKAQSTAYRKTSQRFGKRFVYCANSGFLPILSKKIKEPPLTDIFDIHTYIGMPFRVMMPSEKVSWVMMPTRLKEIHQRFKESYREAGFSEEKPFLAMEVPAGGWAHAQIGKFSQYFDKNGEVPPASYIKASAESEQHGILSIGAWDMKNASFLDKLAGPKRNMPILNKIDKHSIEGVRLYDKVRGICVSHATKKPPEIQRIVYQSVLPMLKKHDAHFFTNCKATFESIVVNDSNVTLKQPALRVSIRKAPTCDLPSYDKLQKHLSEPALLQKTISLKDLSAGKRADVNFSFDLPSLAEGDYRLDMEVFSEGKRIGINTYILMFASKNFPKINGKTIVLGSGKSAEQIKSLLQKSGISAEILSFNQKPEVLRDQLKKVRFVVLAPTKIQTHNALEKAGPVLRSWIERGGRFLALELSGTGTIPFVSEWTLGNEGPSWFADIGVGRKHPIFDGLKQEHFDSWNGDNGYLARSVVLPMNLNMLAVTVCVESDQLGATVLEAKVDSGKVILSQLLVLERIENDPAAARYFNNLIRYFFADKDYRTCQPLLAGRKFKYDCDPSQCFFVNLRPYVNRNFYDTTPASHDGWADQGENDLRHIPRGLMDQDKRIWEIEYNQEMRDKQFFAGIPFDVIEPKTNNNKACIVLAGELRREFPKAVNGIKVGKKAVRLYFLHTAVFGNPPKVARYVIHYSDGTAETIVLRGKYEIADWWAPVHLANALRAWSGVHPVTRQHVGVYAMEYVNPHPEKMISTIDFISEGKVVPILLGITGRTK